MAVLGLVIQCGPGVAALGAYLTSLDLASTLKGPVKLEMETFEMNVAGR